MSDSNSDSQRLLLETLAMQAKTIQTQAETIARLLTDGPAIDDTPVTGAVPYLDGSWGGGRGPVA